MNEFVLIYRFLIDYSTVIKYFNLATLIVLKKIYMIIYPAKCLNCPNVFNTSTPKKKIRLATLFQAIESCIYYIN